MATQTTRAALRLVLVTQGTTVPEWLCKCLRDAERSGVATLASLVQVAQPRARGVRDFLLALYQIVDRRLFRGDPDALEPVSARSAFPNARVLVGADLAALRNERIDVVLDPFSLLVGERFAQLAIYGIWTTTFGESDDPRTQTTPAWWEVVEGRPTTATRLSIRRTGADTAASVYDAIAPTDLHSTSRNHNHVCWRLAAAITRQLELLRDDPNAFLARLEAAPRFETLPIPSRAPGNVDVLRAGTRLLGRYLSARWTNTVYREQWALAYLHGSSDETTPTGAYHRLMPPSDRLWADPFPVRVGSEYFIFHEELLFSTGKGSIVVTVVDDTGHVAQPIPVLETGYHLSYPFVFEWDGEVFMIPETGARRQVELHRCVEFPARWTLERVLLTDVTAFDSTLAHVSGQWWMFASIPAHGAHVVGADLHAFHADSPLGPWTPHRGNPIKSDVRSTRPAGRVFERDGQLYRPAQDCSERYGGAVSINRIVRLDPDAYEEVERHRIVPQWRRGRVGRAHVQSGRRHDGDRLFGPDQAGRPPRTPEHRERAPLNNGEREDANRKNTSRAPHVLVSLLAATLIAAGCRDAVSPERGRPRAPELSHSPTGAHVTGRGALSPGPATPGGDRQEFDFDVHDGPGGRVFYKDWSQVRPDGVSVVSVTVDPATDPATGITLFTPTSSACVTFGGTLRVDDTRELFQFTMDACDNASRVSAEICSRSASRPRPTPIPAP